MSGSDTGNGSQGQEPGAGNQGQGQEPASQQDQNGGQGQEPGGQQGGTADITKMSEADLRTYAAKVQKDAEETRREAAKYRTDYQTAQQKVTEAERAQMTEAQRIQADLDAARSRSQELEKTVKDLTVGSAAREALTTAGALNAQTALRILDLSQVETNQDGTPKKEGLAQAITELKRTDPYLFKRTASADAGAGGGGAPEGGTSINDFVRGNRR